MDMRHIPFREVRRRLTLGHQRVILRKDDGLSVPSHEGRCVLLHDPVQHLWAQSAGMRITRILIVDDEAPIRRGLTMRLGAEADMVVVGEAGDGPLAIERAHNLRPDVVLMDVRMPGLDGLSAAAMILAQNPGTSIVFLTMHDDARVRLEASRIGAAAVVGKQMIEEELLTTIRAVTAARDGV
jgi:CheY-like chemotaxis protein